MPRARRVLTRIFKHPPIKPRYDGSPAHGPWQSKVPALRSRKVTKAQHDSLSVGKPSQDIRRWRVKEKKGRRGGIGKEKERLVGSSKLPDAILHPGAGGTAEIERTSSKGRGCGHGDMELARTAMQQPGEALSSSCPVSVGRASKGGTLSLLLLLLHLLDLLLLVPRPFSLVCSRHVPVAMCSRLTAEVLRGATSDSGKDRGRSGPTKDDAAGSTLPGSAASAPSHALT